MYVGECDLLQYADDSNIKTRDKDLIKCIKRLEYGLQELSDWLETIGLKISTEKTKLMILTRKKKLPQNITIKLNNQTINKTDAVKFLGVTLDSKLNWKPFINAIQKNSVSGINIMKTLTNILQDLSGVPSLKLRAGMICGRYLARTYQNISHPLIPELKYTERQDQRKKSILERNKSFIYKTWIKY